MTSPPSPLDFEIEALRWTLKRLLKEQPNIESLCKHVPRIANAAANVLKTEAALTSSHISIDANAVRQALEELTADITNEEK